MTAMLAISILYYASEAGFSFSQAHSLAEYALHKFMGVSDRGWCHIQEKNTFQ